MDLKDKQRTILEPLIPRPHRRPDGHGRPWLAEELAEADIELIPPHRSNRRVETQDGRPLWRYRRRWKIERLFAWLFNFRLPTMRWEYDALNFLGFVHLGCIVIRPT